ncbi:MAG: hypothetical protein RLZZ232_1147 [Planctomycetota bacterium]|jgi:hypothetical protein
MGLTGIFNDDQVAILGAFLALTVCGLITALSFRFGAGGHSQSEQATLPLTNSERKTDGDVKSGRRAA